MPYDITIGRDDEEKAKFGMQGTYLLGKQYVRMGQVTSLSNNVFMDVGKSHVVFLCGKRGSGKSYTLGNMAEGMMGLSPDVIGNLSVIILDTMGIYWTMKYENRKDRDILEKWDMEPRGMNVQIYTPIGFYETFKDKGIPTDHPFAIRPADLKPSDWATVMEIKLTDPLGVLIERVTNRLLKTKTSFSIHDIIVEIRNDKKVDQQTRDAAENRFANILDWGLFDENGMNLSELALGGQISVVDVSAYATISNGWNIKSLVVGLLCQHIFESRMVARRNEEFEEIQQTVHMMGESVYGKKELPLVWVMIDEAHEFLPREGWTLASGPLITILREGRQPGVSLVLASQQPGKIHTDVMTQSDTVIVHRLTAKIDIDALGMLMQSYMRDNLDVAINNLPRIKGAALVFDDSNERMYTIQVRPRITWHGGGSPSPILNKKKLFSR